MQSFNSALLTVNLAGNQVRCFLESDYDIKSKQCMSRHN